MRDLAAVYRARAGRYPDYWLLLLTLVLVVFGLVMVYSASVMVAVRVGLPDNYYFLREAEFGAIGFCALIAVSAYDYRKLRNLAAPGYIAAVLMLTAVLIPRVGMRVDGAQRWIGLGPVGQVQPSEIAKLALVFLLASTLAESHDAAKGIRALCTRFLLPIALPAVLVMREPDLGTTCIMVATAIAVYLAAGASLWLLPLVLGGLGGAFALLVAVAPYRLGRILVFRALFLNPWDQAALDRYNIQSDAYHIQQSVLALGSGGPLGLGLGYGRQRFGYLPAPHTDSIFAIIGEELGLAGCALVILLFVLLAWRGFRVARLCQDRFGSLLATGLTASLAVQAFINIGVVTDSIPFTGVPLPFISFGGSSLVVSLCAVGLLLSVSRYGGEAAPLPRRMAVPKPAAAARPAQEAPLPAPRPARPRQARPAPTPIPVLAFLRSRLGQKKPAAKPPRRAIAVRSPVLVHTGDGT